MKLLYLLLFSNLFSCSSPIVADTDRISSNRAKPTYTTQKVLLELFTSQGCSSCPAADKLVSRLANEDSDLLIISYHVDYWDRLGWKDVFSCHQFTERQKSYANDLQTKSIYTPQAVVNGQYVMVGSNRMGIQNAIATVQREDPEVKLFAKAERNGSRVNIFYSLSRLPAATHMQIVLVQKHAVTQINKGENRGIKLQGFNIARNFQSFALANTHGEAAVMLPQDLDASDAAVILFISYRISRKIVATAMAEW